MSYHNKTLQEIATSAILEFGVMTNKTKKLLCFSFFLGLVVYSKAQQADGFTLEQSREFHLRFEPEFVSWTVGGNYSRYININATEFWPSQFLRSVGPVRDLPKKDSESVGDLNVTIREETMKFSDYLRSFAIDGVIVIDDGVIVFEDYPKMRPDDRHLWYSISKTMVSTSIAILEDRGIIDVHVPISDYLNELKGTSWGPISVIDILDMASGIDCPEVKGIEDSCFWEFYDAFGWPVAQEAVENPWAVVASMNIKQSPGEERQYTSVNTEVLSWLIETVTGESYNDFVQREIWSKVGAESDAVILATPTGRSFSAGGVSSTLRDLGRYGLLFVPSGRKQDSSVVSTPYLNRIIKGGRPELLTENSSPKRSIGDNSTRHSTYQWDVVTTDGDFAKLGFHGQGLYISPSRDLVSAWFGTPDIEGPSSQMLKAARQLAVSGLLAH